MKILTWGHILHWYFLPVPLVVGALERVFEDLTGCGTTSICCPDGVGGRLLLFVARLPLAWLPYKLWCNDGDESKPPDPERPSSTLLLLGPNKWTFCFLNSYNYWLFFSKLWH